jgi:hypothetical protein
VEAAAGECKKFLKHVLDNICAGNEAHYEYLVRWMARAVQHPDSPGQIAVVLRGKRGTGKSFFAKTFGSLFGRHFLQIADPKHLVGSFNAHLRDCVVLFGDEAFYAGDKKHESVLKALVTEETIPIETKGVDVEILPNYLHLILASNDQWVVPAGADERRYFVLDVGEGSKQKPPYFRAIADEMNSGGREALLYLLLQLDIEKFEVRDFPLTAALQEQKEFSLSLAEEWWLNKLIDGRLLPDHGEWTSEVNKEALVLDYFDYARNTGTTRRGGAVSLGRFFNRVCEEGYPKRIQKRVIAKTQDEKGRERSITLRPYYFEFPDLESCRKIFVHVCLGGSYDWPTGDKQ